MSPDPITMKTAFDLVDNEADKRFVHAVEQKYRCHFEIEYWARMSCMDNRLLALEEAFGRASGIDERSTLWENINQLIIDIRNFEADLTEWLRIMEATRQKLVNND